MRGENGLIMQRESYWPAPIANAPQPMTIATRYSWRVARRDTTGRQRGCLSLRKARATPSFQVHPGGFHHRDTIAPTKRPPASRTSLLPFGDDPRGAPCVASSIFLPHSCTEDDQVYPPRFPKGIHEWKKKGIKARTPVCSSTGNGANRKSVR